MRLLVTGAAGMLGRDVCAAARAAGHDVIATDREDVDVADARAARAAIERAYPDVVVNCAAWTDVDGAEADEQAATLVNGLGAGHVAAAAAAAGAFLVQISTDYVFDGTGVSPYPEDVEPRPLSAYGRSKLAGEQAVAAQAPGTHAIARTSWLFGAHGRNFVETMLRVGGERDEVTVVDDQVGSPTYTGHLAEALIELAEARAPGIFHLTGAGSCSWYDLAVETFARSGVDCRVQRGRTADLGRPAPRPAYSVLGVTRAGTPVLPDWRQGLDDYLSARAALAVARR
jgi:dTDP-4-dehydrorhamnose reductase